MPGSTIGNRSPSVTLIVASIDARTTLSASLGQFLDEVGDRGDVILVDASRDGTAEESARLFPRLQVIRRPPGTLIPVLWGVGLRASTAPLVVFSTAAMVPREGWLDALIARLDETGAAGVGGPIAPGQALSAFDRAVYLHRYLAYRPLDGGTREDSEGRLTRVEATSQSSRELTFKPPGENALYSRDALVDLESTWDDGFWEVSVQNQLRENGDRLALAPDALVRFEGGSRRGSTLRQRVRHARRYASDRARNGSRGMRFLRLGAVPLVPVLMLARIARRLAIRRESPRGWLRAVPDLSSLIAAWTIGEALGLIRSPASCRPLPRGDSIQSPGRGGKAA